MTGFDCPRGLAVSVDGATLFVADFNNYKIRQVDVATGAVTTLADCKLPDCIAVSCDGTELLVSCGNSSLNRIVLGTTADQPLVIPPLDAGFRFT